MKKLVDKYKALSYRKKVFAGMITAAFIPILICTLGVVLAFKISNEGRLTEEAEDVAEEALAILDKDYDDICEAINDLVGSSTVKRMIESDGKEEVSVVYRQLYNIYKLYGDYSDYAIYDADGKLLLVIGDKGYIKDKLSVNWGILYVARHYPTEICARNARIYYGDETKQFLRLGRTVTDENGDAIGYVVATVNPTHWANMFSKLNIDTFGAIYITDSFNENIYMSSSIDATVYEKAKNEVLVTDGNAAKYYETENHEYRFYHTYDTKCGFHFFYRQEVMTYYTVNKSLTFILIVMAVVGLSLCLVLSRKLSNRFYRPIARMEDGMKQIKKGNFDVKITVESDDELGHLSTSFNEMSERLTDNMEKLVNRERELADANIRMMQAQLNPHFIYNTLDTMKWLGKSNEMPEVATLSSGLAKIMRASISAGQTVTLKQEVELCESYVEIQKIRFDDKFEFVVDLDEDLLDLIVPKLILQPIAENSILHGFDGRSCGSLMLYGKITDGNLFLFMKDDGKGIQKDILDKLNNGEELHTGSGIGFHNVDSIIKLRYGSEYGLSVTSDLNTGTEVKYVLPVNRERS